MIKSSQLSYITGAYFSGLGYYVEISPEVPETAHRPDVLAVKPRLKEVALRFEKGGAPVGIIYLLKKDKWFPLAYILQKTGLEPSFVNRVLHEAEENGWVKSKVESDSNFSWSIDKYRIPVTECTMIMCAAENPIKALEIFHRLEGCYNKAYVVFPYQVHDSFIHECAHRSIGVMVFEERTASFQFKLEAKHQKITGTKAYASICEKTIINHAIMNPNRIAYQH